MSLYSSMMCFESSSEFIEEEISPVKTLITLIVVCMGVFLLWIHPLSYLYSVLIHSPHD